MGHATTRRARVSAKRAKILSDEALARVQAYVAGRRYPLRGRVMVLLSCKAGLRAMEIARIERRHVLDAEGRVGELLHLPDYVCKKGSGREVPMAPDLRGAIEALLAAEPDWPVNAPLVLSERSLTVRAGSNALLHAMTEHAVSVWFGRVYRACGLDGASSHSGRRTFITRAARSVTKAGGSLRDVQELAGHASITTTQAYIEGDSDAKRRLVRMV